MTRLAVVDGELCKPDKCALECIKVCPVNKMRKECIVLADENKRASIAVQLCTGCGICVKKCPFHAITVINLVAPVEEKLVYSYGNNAFRLYGLALPRKGITGIIGENGCGKTTNVKLLHNDIAIQKKPSKEIEAYFHEKKSLVIKPQEMVSAKLGNVGKLFDKIGGERLEEIKRAFDLDALWDRKFSELSGGELQRVVVAASLLKEGDVHILDEPFAFLDYAYRIRLIEYLREHFMDKSVLVVDHDLSLLSYLCSHVYLLFGEPGAYGIVSQSYATERGINMFLDGFIGPENVKFREEPVQYKPLTPDKKKDVLFTLPECEVKKGGFTVTSSVPIGLFDGEVVGVVGRNGIGKSSFCERVWKENEDLVAFKPQVLSRGDGIVAELLKADTPFKELFIKNMRLKKLEFYPFRHLSGGELQKVEVFRALAEEKPVCVLDEPTNMMDVTGRIILSKMLREKANEGKAVLVVDHDLEFVLNTVDRLIVLEGEPTVRGEVKGIYSKEEGTARLLGEFDLSYRRDELTKRLKLNKRGSVKDRELKESGKFVE